MLHGVRYLIAAAGLVLAAALAPAAGAQTWGPSSILPATVHGVPVGCLVDTGSQFTIVAREFAEFAKMPEGDLGDTPPLIAGLAGGRIRTRVVASDVRLGELAWSGARVLIPTEGNFYYSCVIGTDLLSQQPLLIDLAQREVRRAGA